MPEQLPVDWEAIKTAFVKGDKVDKLSQQYGVKPNTIYARALRNGWKSSTEIARKEARYAAKHAINQHIAAAVASVKPELDSAIKEWTGKSIGTARKLVEHVSNTLDNSCPPPEDLQRLAGALDRADSIGRRGYGLDKRDDGQGERRVNISIGLVGAVSPDGALMSVTTDGLRMDYASGEPVVDVEAEDITEARNC